MTDQPMARPRGRRGGNGAPALPEWQPTDADAPDRGDYAYGDRPWDELDDERVTDRRIERLRTAYQFPEPEDRGKARLSPTGETEYIEDLIRPGRIVTWAAEEGSGKSYAVNGELAIRVALAGGSFAGTWPVLDVGTVLVLSEMHADEDYQREERILSAVGRTRAELSGGLYRLPLMTAAGGAPVLTDERWRAYITDWCRRMHCKLLIFDTATGATQVDPWGRAIQGVFRDLRLMLEQAPDLAIVLVVHCKKPTGRGRRAISDVLGEWGRWCDVVVLMESDGPQRVKLSSRKRVHQERWILATKRDGLLVEPVDLADTGPKVPLEQVIAAIRDEPGMTSKGLGARLEVTTRTAQRYAELAEAAGRVRHDAEGPRGAFRWHAEEAVEQLLSTPAAES